jgi:hypothetical protein
VTGDAVIKRYEEEEWDANESIENNDIPSEVTVNRILKKHGMVVSRRKGRRRIENQNPYFDPAEPNQIWSCDFKGKFRMQNGQYCNPLTVVDRFMSRKMTPHAYFISSL